MIYILMVALLMTFASIVHGQGKYAEVNGLRVYYEIHGKGEPLVLLHGGGSTRSRQVSDASSRTLQRPVA